MVDLSILIGELTNAGFTEQPEVNADTIEFAKTLRSGDQEVFMLDFTNQVVEKLRYNAKDVLQANATQKFTIKHPQDLNQVLAAMS